MMQQMLFLFFVAFHIMKCLLNSFGESHNERLVSRKALRERNARYALPVYHGLDYAKSNGQSKYRSDEKSVVRKIA